MNILGIGEIVLDKVIVLNNFPKEGEKIKPIEIKYSLGGPVPSALILLSNLGANCKLIASIGKDDQAKIIKQNLNEKKIKIFPQRIKKTKINTVLINKKNGFRTIIKDKTQPNLIKKIPEKYIRNADLIFFDRHEPEAFKEVIKKKKPNTKIITDPSTEISKKTIHMCKHSDYPIIPIEILENFNRSNTIQNNLKEFQKLIKKTIIVTLGEKGSLIFDGKKINFIPAAKINAIDTNGAGDIYRGAFGYGIINKWPINRCAIYANKISAMQCTHLGNGSAIPTKEEINKLKNKLKLKKISLNI